VLIELGFALEIPPGYEGQIRPRSGLAKKAGITVLNAPGTLDADYRGEVRVMLINHREPDCSHRIEPGDRIAQIVFAAVEVPELVPTDELSETERGDGGFGSTDKPSDDSATEIRDILNGVPDWTSKRTDPSYR
jgi:dUTP pyrophosphatase